MLKGDDKAAIDKKAEALMQAAANIAQQAAAAQAGGAGAGAGQARPAGGASAGAQSKANDDAVDAEFEEVKDKKKAS